MGESVKKYGVDGKKRFTTKYPFGVISRFGTCDPKEDERFGVAEKDGEYFLVQYQQNDYDYSQPEKQRVKFPEGTLIANGYYDNEHDEFVSPQEWLAQH